MHYCIYCGEWVYIILGCCPKCGEELVNPDKEYDKMVDDQLTEN